MGVNDLLVISAVSLVRYHDKDQDLIFLPERQNLILANVPNPVGNVITQTPSPVKVAAPAAKTAKKKK